MEPTTVNENKRKKDHRISNQIKKEILIRLEKGEAASALAAEFCMSPSLLTYYIQTVNK